MLKCYTMNIASYAMFEKCGYTYMYALAIKLLSIEQVSYYFVSLFNSANCFTTYHIEMNICMYIVMETIGDK